MNSRRTGIICAVRGCHNNWYKRKRFLEQVCFDHKPRTRAECGCEAPYNLHPPPKNEEALRFWVKALNLEKPPKRPYVCSFHFVDKRPTKEHPYPEKWLGYDAPVNTLTQLLVMKTSTHKDETLRSPEFVPSQFAHTSVEQEQRNARNPKRCEQTLQLKRKRNCDADETPVLSTDECNATDLEKDQCAEHSYLANVHSLQTITPCTNTACQAAVKALTDECAALRAEIARLKEKVDNLSFRQESFRDSDGMVQELTGLASYAKFMIVFSLVSGFLKAGSGLTNFQCFFITLMRMRLNLPLCFFAHMFHVSQSTVAEVFNVTLDVMHQTLCRLIVWPGKEQIQISLPMCFRSTLNNCTSVIDCLELCIEKPKNLSDSAQTCSQYKNHDTVKYLISITPQGVISFVSKGLGGQVSDKYLTERCGYLDKLSTGDVILAGKGFNIIETVGLHTADLKIQAFTKGKHQLLPLELDKTKGLVAVQMHVERVISLVRNKYTILQSTIPISLCNTTDEGHTTTLDKMVTVCCALCNICPCEVPTD